MDLPPPPVVPAAPPEKPRVLKRKYTLLHPEMLSVLGAFFGPPPTLKLDFSDPSLQHLESITA